MLWQDCENGQRSPPDAHLDVCRIDLRTSLIITDSIGFPFPVPFGQLGGTEWLESNSEERALGGHSINLHYSQILPSCLRTSQTLDPRIGYLSQETRPRALLLGLQSATSGTDNSCVNLSYYLGNYVESLYQH